VLSKYRDLGVDVKKTGIENFREGLDNLFPGAFCVVQKDPEDDSTGLILHTDSAGSKPIQAYLMYKETGDPSYFSGLAQDALAMNVNDVLCVAAEPVSFVDYIAFNTLNIDRIQLLGSIAKGFTESKQTLNNEGIPILFGGGETADLPDLLRTLDVCVTLFARAPIQNIITGKKIISGDKIIGLRSGGTLRYEKSVNSGIMSNGHTLARNCLLNANYVKKYPELSYPNRERFTGEYYIDTFIDDVGMTVGEALLSPTRFYAPIISKVLENCYDGIHGLVHNTGGGQTKCLRTGTGIKYIKNKLPEPDPIFSLIQQAGKVEWKEMYQDFNMGVGFEIVSDQSYVDKILGIAESFKLEAQVIGHCEKSLGDNKLEIKSEYGKFGYN